MRYDCELVVFVGVPEITPVVVSKLTPVGRFAEEAAYQLAPEYHWSEYVWDEPVAPLRVGETEVATPILKFTTDGIVAVKVVDAAFTVIVKAREVADSPSPSRTTSRRSLADPGAVGVPDILPVAVSKDRPAGSVPTMLQTSVGTAESALGVKEDPMAIEKGAETADPPAASVIRSEMPVLVSIWVGVPKILPVVADSDAQLGRVPLSIVQFWTPTALVTEGDAEKPSSRAPGYSDATVIWGSPITEIVNEFVRAVA
jgi:hypothetical protein